MKLFILTALFTAGKAFHLPISHPRAGRTCLHDSPQKDHVVGGESDRRTFVMESMLATAAGLSASVVGAAPVAAADVDYKAVAADIAALVNKDPDKGPTLVRLAWHSSGTYDKMSKTGGSGGGTIRFKEELAHGGNAGLGETAVKWMEPIYKKYKGACSYADLYTLAGGKE